MKFSAAAIYSRPAWQLRLGSSAATALYNFGCECRGSWPLGGLLRLSGAAQRTHLHLTAIAARLRVAVSSWNADDATKDFRYGALMCEGTFSKAGQDWLHNPPDNSLQHSFDDGAWRVVDLPHDWAVELPYMTVDSAGKSIHVAHGGKALGRNFPETSIG